MTRVLPDKGRLPHALYRAEQVRALDRCAIDEQGIPGAVLMERAGEAAYRFLRERWPNARALAILCGVGNNGGDGYVVARLARQDGLSVRVLQLGDVARLSGDALLMAQRLREVGAALQPFQGLEPQIGLIVDAVLGTGLERAVTGTWAQALDAVNRHQAPVLALDIPSGLHSDTGSVLGTAVRADATVSFIGLKQGMFTGQGPDCCGEIRFHGLQVPALVYSREILSARRIDWEKQQCLLRPRRRAAHKGDFGHVLVVGGAPGFSGAARMCAEAALRCGAGLVSLATHPDHAAWANLGRPELMCHPVVGADGLDTLLERAEVVAIGPGLGRGGWSQALLDRVLASELPLVVDADALNLLAARPLRRDNWILTPHPGEAGRLLGIPAQEVELDRFAAAANLQHCLGGVLVLKGAGSLVQGEGRRPPAVCSDGNPGMASGGMGDVLTGLIAGFVAQGFELEEAACMGVSLHAAAADKVARQQGERGLLATDLFNVTGPMLNPSVQL